LGDNIKFVKKKKKTGNPIPTVNEFELTAEFRSEANAGTLPQLVDCKDISSIFQDSSDFLHPVALLHIRRKPLCQHPKIVMEL
jgi:hypothetical protein